MVNGVGYNFDYYERLQNIQTIYNLSLNNGISLRNSSCGYEKLSKGDDFFDGIDINGAPKWLVPYDRLETIEKTFDNLEHLTNFDMIIHITNQWIEWTLDPLWIQTSNDNIKLSYFERLILNDDGIYTLSIRIYYFINK